MMPAASIHANDFMCSLKKNAIFRFVERRLVDDVDTYVPMSEAALVRRR
jgi:hypothetical protein